MGGDEWDEQREEEGKSRKWFEGAHEGLRGGAWTVRGCDVILWLAECSDEVMTREENISEASESQVQEDTSAKGANERVISDPVWEQQCCFTCTQRNPGRIHRSQR